ncbi:MAG: hypothetical protein ACXQS8_08585 [Candidatus Helarchaeales archaeon]
MTAKKVRKLLQRQDEYQFFSPHLLAMKVAMSLDWLQNAEYLILHQETPPRSYLIPDDFLKKGQNLLSLDGFFS